MTPAAGERLKTIHDFTALGSGFRIAMKDLEIRGAGNLLGPEQSGQMAAVGFDLYVQMLKEAVGELTGEAVPEPIDVRMDLPLDAYIPADYIPDEESRIEAYHDLAGAQDASELAIIESRLVDRYGGPLPAPVRGLIQVLDLKGMAAAAGLSEVVVRRDTATLLPIDLTPTQLSVLGREGLKVRYIDNAQKLVVTLGVSAVGTELDPDQVTGGLGEALRAILTTVVQA
jgi:transcription-repair coupling factor (superfamily II helicase)